LWAFGRQKERYVDILLSVFYLIKDGKGRSCRFSKLNCVRALPLLYFLFLSLYLLLIILFYNALIFPII